jgi:hypothetical protein
MNKTLPVIGVDQDVANRPLACRIGNPPMESNPVPLLAFVFGEWNGLLPKNGSSFSERITDKNRL